MIYKSRIRSSRFILPLTLLYCQKADRKVTWNISSSAQQAMKKASR